jgi:hypothetical protein
MLKIIMCISLIFAFASTGHSQSVNQYSWLVGEWVCENEGLTTNETWSLRNDSILVGTSFTVNENYETVFEEALKIESTIEGTRYIAVLPSKTAVFNLKSSTKSSLTFSNPKNDFPKDITYKTDSKGLTVTLSGENKKEIMKFGRQK